MAMTATPQVPSSLEVIPPDDNMEISSEYNRFDDDDIEIDVDLATDPDVDYMLEDAKSDFGQPTQAAGQYGSRDDLMVDRQDDDGQSDLMQDNFSAVDEQLSDVGASADADADSDGHADAEEINYDEEPQELQAQQEDAQHYEDTSIPNQNQGVEAFASVGDAYPEGNTDTSYPPADALPADPSHHLDIGTTDPQATPDTPSRTVETARRTSGDEDFVGRDHNDITSTDANANDDFDPENGAQSGFDPQEFVGHTENDSRHDLDYYAGEADQQPLSLPGETENGLEENEEKLPATVNKEADAGSPYVESENPAPNHEDSTYNDNENTSSDTRKDHHCILVMYGGNEFSLFPPQIHEPARPSILQDYSIVSSYLSNLFASLRQGLGSNISDAEELEISIPKLDLYVGEDSKHAANTTLNEMLETHSLLQYNEGIDSPEPLVITLTTQTRFSKRLEYLRDFAINGGVVSQLTVKPNDGDSHDHTRVEDSEYQYEEPEGSGGEIGAGDENESVEETVIELYHDHIKDPSNTVSQDDAGHYSEAEQQQEPLVLVQTDNESAVAEPDKLYTPTTSNNHTSDQPNSAQDNLGDSVEEPQEFEPALVHDVADTNQEEDDLIDYEDDEEEPQDHGSSRSSTIQGERSAASDNLKEGTPRVFQNPAEPTERLLEESANDALSAGLARQTKENIPNNDDTADSISYDLEEDIPQTVSEGANVEENSATIEALHSLRGGEAADASLQQNDYTGWNDDVADVFATENPTDILENVFEDPLFASTENWEEYAVGDDNRQAHDQEELNLVDPTANQSNDEDEITYEDEDGDEDGEGEEDENEESSAAVPQAVTTETPLDSTPKASPGTKRTFSEHLEEDSGALSDEVKRVRSH